jgi:predicted RNA polymerase sigma factor
MAFGPQTGLDLLDQIKEEPELSSYHLLPSVRGDLLEKAGRPKEAAAQFKRAAELTENARERDLLTRRAEGQG